MDDNGKQDPRLGKTSASNAAADELCPGRHQAQLAAKEVLGEQTSSDADFGSGIHNALAAQDPSKLDPEQLKTYELCQQVEAGILERYFSSDAMEAMQKQWRHRRLWGIFGKHEHSGELDVVYRLGPRALIIEYKCLFGDVESSPRNKQLRDQAVLAWKHFLTLEEIAVAVDQPHLTLKPDICIYRRPDLQKAEAEMTARIVASNAPGAKRISGELQCQFCDAKALCKEYHLWAAAKLPMKQCLLEDPVAAWSTAQWVEFCDGMGIAQKWLNMAKDEAKKKLKADPNSIPGFCLTDGRKQRTVVKVNELYARFEKLGGKLENFHNCIDVLLGKLETELRAVTNAKGKGLEKAMDAILSGLIEETRTEGSIARKEGK